MRLPGFWLVYVLKHMYTYNNLDEDNNLYEGTPGSTLSPQPFDSYKTVESGRFSINHVLIAQFP